MKIGILTFHCAANYGAVFQTYGLQEHLKSLGHDVRVIDYRPDYLFAPYRNFKTISATDVTFAQFLRENLRLLLTYPIRWSRNHKFAKFISSEFQLAKVDFNNPDNDFDAFIFGSDQIWNPTITGDLDSIYTGNFKASEKKIKIAYAASAGSAEFFTKLDLQKLSSDLSLFNAVSVREKSLKQTLQPMLSQTVEVVLDPVLLAGKDVFDKLATSFVSKNPYLLFFQLGKNQKDSCFARKIAVERGLDFIEIRSSAESLKDNSVKDNLSPNEFLGYFKNASYILTSSFHGTAFSILFEKDFNTISVDSIINERAKNLLQMLGLEDRLCRSEYIGTQGAIDYPSVREKLNGYRKYSSSFLQEHLQ